MLDYNVEVNGSLFHISRCVRLLVCHNRKTIMHCTLVSKSSRQTLRSNKRLVR